MRYISTRGGLTPSSFEAILLGGLAPDGGLVVPEHYPHCEGPQIESWRGLSYAELAFEILKLYITDWPETSLRALIDKSYTLMAFGSREVTPLKQLDPQRYLLRLSNGPTLAFKDIAMQLLGHLFEYVLLKRGEHLNILGATSGDTGSAAEYAMRGKRGVRVFMLSPDGKMSAFQTAQMFSLLDQNIFNIALDGVFDDAQDLVKAVSSDLTFKDRYAIGTVNSINWARVLAQVVYYFKGYFAATKAMTEPEPSGEEPMSQRPPRVQEVSFCVPSGNFGNILAGHIARQMGLPIRRLVLATNENNVLDEFFRTGRYRPRLSQETRQTSSPSMDISKASNFERFMFDLLDRDPVQTRGLWAQIDQQGYFDLSDDPRWQQQVARFGLVSGSSSHRLRIDTIREVYQRFEELIDPHTADGVAVSQAFIEAGVPMICLETAQPAKFADTMVEALGVAPPVPAGFQHLQQSAQRFCRMPKDLAVLKAYIRRHAPAR
ncbi:MAG: threonine synthase [Betaproteobacteria bacterium]|jgi:threonine synthase|nr:threonine synthase [Betaproteobacteria bacterium]NBP34692.1 threonine synthase [Betaproteobacteria bacterium]NBQ78531.1 threonine synthase [Betaproteobacteria bacterium]NBQ95208.1 threonine synthase [Betaproteobacteria bacterium]NBS39276.1 threonine synthase [Betaproteobacteria bacterium]